MAGAIFGTVVYPKLHKRTKTFAKKREAVIKPYKVAKSELQSLEFERSFLYEAITRVYEAAQEGRIDTLERDRLLLKYKRQLAIHNEKIEAIRPIVDLSELSDMRDDVTNLLEKRISIIDQKLAELFKKYAISSTDFSSKSKISIRQPPMSKERNIWQQQQEVAEAIKPKEKETGTQSHAEYVNYYNPHAQFGEEEELTNKEKNTLYEGEQISEVYSDAKNVEKLQKEIMEALYRLEQVGSNSNDIEHNNRNGDIINNNNNNNSATYQYTRITSNPTDRSCLRQLLPDKD